MFLKQFGCHSAAFLSQQSCSFHVPNAVQSQCRVDRRIIVLWTDCNVIKIRSCCLISGIDGAAPLTNRITAEKTDEAFTGETGHLHGFSLNYGTSCLVLLLVTESAVGFILYLWCSRVLSSKTRRKLWLGPVAFIVEAKGKEKLFIRAQTRQAPSIFYLGNSFLYGGASILDFDPMLASPKHKPPGNENTTAFLFITQCGQL